LFYLIIFSLLVAGRPRGRAFIVSLESILTEDVIITERWNLRQFLRNIDSVKSTITFLASRQYIYIYILFIMVWWSRKYSVTDVADKIGVDRKVCIR
jgi:hypothetical protein